MPEEKKTILKPFIPGPEQGTQATIEIRLLAFCIVPFARVQS